MTLPQYKFIIGDALRTGLPNKSVDIVIGSGPYESQRTYGIGFNLKGQAFVDWMVAGFREWLRVSRGPVIMVLEGYTDDYRWSASPALLMADLHRAGIHLRKPPAFHRVGIPGSGGPDWLRNDYEFIVCATNGGKLPWSDNTAMGHPPKYGPGGAPSHRTTATRGNRGGDTRVQNAVYVPPAKANPGNVIRCKVGGGLMGHKLSGKNEAPFPETLCDFFIRSFCPPGGIVLDPFCGSGTTIAAAVKAGRSGVGIDIRTSQIKISRVRLAEVMRGLQAAENGGGE